MLTHVHCARPFFGSTPTTWIYHCTARQIDSICSSTFNLFVSSSSLGVFYRWSHSSHIHCSTCNAMQWLRLRAGTLYLNNDKITCRLSHLTRRYLFSPMPGSAAPIVGRLSSVVATISQRSHCQSAFPRNEYYMFAWRMRHRVQHGHHRTQCSKNEYWIASFVRVH